MQINCFNLWVKKYKLRFHQYILNQLICFRLDIESVSLPSAMKLRRLCFYMCLSVHRGEYLNRYTWDQVHPLRPGTPPDQVHPPGPGTLPRTRYTPWDQVHPPGPGTPPDQVHPPGPGTLPRTRYTPWNQVHPQDQVHPLGPGSPPLDQVHPQGPGAYPRKWLMLQMVRILLECILVTEWF